MNRTWILFLKDTLFIEKRSKRRIDLKYLYDKNNDEEMNIMNEGMKLIGLLLSELMKILRIAMKKLIQ